jgi:hypothetical protein
METKFDIKEILKDKEAEDKLRKGAERHLTQDDILKLVQKARKPDGNRDVKDE